MTFPFHAKTNLKLILQVCLLSLAAISPGCSSSSARISDAVSTGHESALFSTVLNAHQKLYAMNPQGFRERFTAASFPSAILRLIRCGTMTAAVTESDGIFLLPDIGSTEQNPLHIPVSPNALTHRSIYDITCIIDADKTLLYITYYTPAGNGVTECTITGERSYTCRTFTKDNSELKSNLVYQVVKDEKNNIWFRYSPNTAEGVSRINEKGNWHHYTIHNSGIGGNSILNMQADGGNDGFPGINIWFFSRAGLSRLSLSGKEEWFFYGDKNTFINTFTQAIGIQSWFTDAIVDIVDLCILPQSVLIANKNALFDFSEKNVSRVLPETTGGIDRLQISEVQAVGDSYFVKIRPAKDRNPVIRYFTAYSVKSKKWLQIKYWEIHNAYASDISIHRYNDQKCILLITYSDGATKALFLLFNDYSLHPIDFPPSR